jgi:hypothetical protein
MQSMRAIQIVHEETCKICRKRRRCRSIPAGRAAIKEGLTI